METENRDGIFQREEVDVKGVMGTLESCPGRKGRGLDILFLRLDTLGNILWFVLKRSV